MAENETIDIAAMAQNYLKNDIIPNLREAMQDADARENSAVQAIMAITGLNFDALRNARDEELTTHPRLLQLSTQLVIDRQQQMVAIENYLVQTVMGAGKGNERDITEITEALNISADELTKKLQDNDGQIGILKQLLTNEKAIEMAAAEIAAYEAMSSVEKTQLKIATLVADARPNSSLTNDARNEALYDLVSFSSLPEEEVRALLQSDAGSAKACEQCDP